MKDKVRIGYIGLGKRGFAVLEKNFAMMEDVEVAALSDLSDERLSRMQTFLRENTSHDPYLTKDYHDILNDPTIDAVVIMIGWSGRPKIAMETMRAGKYAAVEVGCADTLDECFELVKTYEETGVPVMMLENCCYGRREMMVLNLVKKGLLGEVVHCSGGYHHNINEEDIYCNFENIDIPHYRLGQYITKNRENYPTHELGPLSKVLSINRGNRMVSLSSFASKSRGLKEYAVNRFGADSKWGKIDYKQGDIVTTVITCAGGETVVLTLDTNLPRSHYSRGFSIRGTKGMTNEDRMSVYFDGQTEDSFKNEEAMYEKYDHPLHAEYVKAGVKEGHGGMDWLVCRAFIESVKNGTNTPIDAYDTAAWMAVGPLSEMSINKGGAPMEFPDFTNGKWQNREPVVKCKYCLDEICEDKSVSVV
ncbi:MAG: Gfo/Idh/MocA family oxidoreductase [Clostridia bacterium]|nr:Gfo/Idh/MocA family oxidoreductase [Clostridia bacterium]